MKITALAIAALFAAAAPLAFSQEDSPSPAASPELTVSEKSKSSDPSVSVTTEKTVSPTPKPKSSASPAKSSSAAPKSSSTPAAKSSATPAAKSSATPAASTSPSPSADMPSKKSTAEATIREIEDKWEASVKNHDSSVAQTYLADDFHGISSKGKVMTKANLLAELKKDTDVYSSTKNGKIDVRVYSGQFAVATGVATEAGKSKEGEEFKRSFRWTDVWVLRNDKWQCVASQAMLVK